MKNSLKPFILSITLIFTVFSAVLAFSKDKTEEKPVVSAINTTEASVINVSTSAPSHNYVAKIWGDSLVIFATDNMNEPYYISNISLYSLTNEDYKKLKDGIYLDTHEDISRLLEDFES